MALRYMDSFDHYTDLTSKGWTTSGCSISAGNGRWSTAGLHLNNSGNFITRIFDAQATWIVGFSWRSAQTVVDTARVIMALMDSSTYQVYLTLDGAGHLQVKNGSGTVLGTGSTVLSVGTVYYFELKVTINNSTGVVALRINGVSELSLTSQDTQNSGNATADGIRMGFGGGGNTHLDYYDDLYVLDGTGSAPTNDFLGDCRVESILPSGNGNSSQLVGSDGNSTDNYLLVDETAPDGDTTYVESSTVSNKDTYAYGNVTPTTGTVFGVQVLPYAQKTDGGARSIASIARLSGTEVDSADKTLSSSYGYLPDIRETKPGGGTWSISDVNSAEFGVKVTA